MTETAIRLAIASLAISITMGVFLHDSHLDMDLMIRVISLKTAKRKHHQNLPIVVIQRISSMIKFI